MSIIITIHLVILFSECAVKVYYFIAVSSVSSYVLGEVDRRHITGVSIISNTVSEEQLDYVLKVWLGSWWYFTLD